MTLDKNKADEVLHGVIVNDPAGGNLVEGPFYTGGPSSPVGLTLPVNTFYVQNVGNEIYVWKKFGAGVNDWRRYSAQDVPVDVSALTANSSDLTGVTQLQEMVAALANRHFGKVYQFVEATTFQTTSATPVTALSYSGTQPAGNYRVRAEFEATNSKSNTNNITRILFNGSVLNSRTQVGIAVNSVTNLKSNLVHPGGTLTALIDLQRTAGNGNAILNTISLELWRVS